MASIWKRLTLSPEGRFGEDASRTQPSSLRSRRVKNDLHRRRSLAGLFTTSSPSKEPDQDITTITCQERIHYPLYNPLDPRHDLDALAYEGNDKGFWASYGRSIRARFQGSTKPGTVSPNTQNQKPRRSIRSSFASFTGSSRLLKRLSRSEIPSSPLLNSIREPLDVSQIEPEDKASHLLPDRADGSQTSFLPEVLDVPRQYYLPSLPSMSSGLMSPLELEACTAGRYAEQETPYVQNYESALHKFSRPVQPFNILQNAVTSMPGGQPAVQRRQGYTNSSNTKSERASLPIPITSKHPPFNRQQARVYRKDNSNLSTSRRKQMQSHPAALDSRKQEKTQIPKDLANGAKPQSLLNLGEQWLETRMQPPRAASPEISEPSTITDSEFGAEMYRTCAPHRYASTTESDAVLSSWLSSLSSICHPRDNTDISGSTLCRSQPPSTRHPSDLYSASVLRRPYGHAQASSRSETLQCSELGISDADTNKHKNAFASKSNSPQQGIAPEFAKLENFSNLNSVRNTRPDVGGPYEVPNDLLNLGIKSTDTPSQLSNSLRKQFCESDLTTGFHEGNLWPGSIDSRIGNDHLKQLHKENRPNPLVLDGHDLEGHGNVQFGGEYQIISATHPAGNQAPGYSGNTRAQSGSQDATNGKIIPIFETSYGLCIDTSTNCGPASRGKSGSQIRPDQGSKSSCGRKNGSSSCSGSGSGDSGQSDPLTNSTAGTSVVDFAKDHNLTTKAKAEERTTSPQMNIMALPSKIDDGALSKC
ncbi:predicted protein [Histoplasma capsulatum G186AR]|uniref:Uncharacterized protein n=2 Tax=Ajellomyces capsulatus TaxID=5037 RepID=C0NZY4_AJECG|nr:uncharacterized protein HCBG_08714 [Histoplasma capsulatum G186AR]EEH03074.1 predicted protein [Histoplasma capsulatum G186AR]